MVEVTADHERIHVSIPTDGMSPEEATAFVNWLRVEAIVRRSKMTEAQARGLSEEIKAGWWARNKWRFGG